MPDWDVARRARHYVGDVKSKRVRIAATLAGVITGSLVGAVTFFQIPVAGAVIGAIASALVAAGMLISNRPSSSEKRFAAMHSWEVSEDSDAVATEALEGRAIVGLGRSAMEGEWRGRRAARFRVGLHEGVNDKDVWIEGVFIDGQIPTADLAPRGSRRIRIRHPDAHKFGRVWKVFSADTEFASELLHDEMRSRLLSAPTPRNWVLFGERFVGVRYEAFAPNCKGTPGRLDLVSDLADLVPRSAWDLLRNRASAGSGSVELVVSRDGYRAAHPNSPSRLPLKVSARSPQRDSLRRVAITVVVVVTLGVIATYVTT